jgi:tRNA uridine 5-carboxymethylaminomethyl modification enzyme
MIFCQSFLPHSAFDLLRNPRFSPDTLKQIVPEAASVPEPILERIVIEGTRFHPPFGEEGSISLIDLVTCTARYDIHLDRQRADLDIFMRDESLALDPSIDYSTVKGLSTEVRQRLTDLRPGTIVRAFYLRCGLFS